MLEGLQKALFITELKNRFKCLVNLNGIETLCYVPSSCKLSNFIELAGCPVLLTKKTTGTKIEYALFAAETKHGYVLLNLAMANKVIAKHIRNRRFSFLGFRQVIKNEVSIDGYKCDLYIENSDTIVEIKTILSLDRLAHFPTIHSERAIQQLRKIEELLDAGHRVAYIFVSLGPRVKEIALDSDEEFAFHFGRCVEKGMTFYGCALKVGKEAVSISSRVEIKY